MPILGVSLPIIINLLRKSGSKYSFRSNSGFSTLTVPGSLLILMSHSLVADPFSIKKYTPN